MKPVILPVKTLAAGYLADAYTLIERHDVKVDSIQAGKGLLDQIREVTKQCRSSSTVLWGAKLKQNARLDSNTIVLSGVGHKVHIVIG